MTAATELETEPGASTFSVGELCLMLRRIGTTLPTIARRYHMTVPAVQIVIAQAEADHADELAVKRSAKQFCRAIFAKQAKPALGGRTDADVQDGWLWLRRQGWLPDEIAEDGESTVHAVLMGLQAAQDRELERKAEGESVDLRALFVVPMYGVRCFTPSSPCPHYGPLRKGSREYCEVCSKSGMDHHWRLKRDPRPKPPKPKPTPLASYTRQERRRLKFAESEAARAKKLLRSLGG